MRPAWTRQLLTLPLVLLPAPERRCNQKICPVPSAAAAETVRSGAEGPPPPDTRNGASMRPAWTRQLLTLPLVLVSCAHRNDNTSLCPVPSAAAAETGRSGAEGPPPPDTRNGASMRPAWTRQLLTLPLVLMPAPERRCGRDRPLRNATASRAVFLRFPQCARFPQ
jgi:hypothetical protein